MESYYFAYGSNMDESRMEKRCCQDAKFSKISRGIMRDWNLVFDKQSKDNPDVVYANIEPKKSSLVEGIIYKINRECVVKLNKAEGTKYHEYFRWYMDIEYDDNKSLMCIVYIANPEKVRKGLYPPKWYLEHLLEGRKCLSPNYVSNLEKIQTSRNS